MCRLAWRFDVSRSVLRGKGVKKPTDEAPSEAAGSSAEAAADAVEEPEKPAAQPVAETDAASLAALAAFHAFLMEEVELGNMSRQEEVSMVPPQLLDVRPGHRVLDMCASPGSKTQQLMEALSVAGDPAVSATGLIIANDTDYRR